MSAGVRGCASAGGLLLALALALPLRAQQAPTRTLVEDLRIDGAEHEFNRITAILPLRNGNVVVLQAGDFNAMLFSPTGSLLKRFARKGAGPGEVQQLAGYGILGDSIWLSDRGQNRVTLFGPDGGTGRSFALTGSVDWTTLRPEAKGAFLPRVYPMIIMPGDVAIGSPGIIASALSAETIRSRPFVRMKWDGSAGRVIADMPLNFGALRIETGGRTIYSSQPFMGGPQFEISRDGRHMVLVEARETSAPVLRIVHMNSAGDTIAATDLPYEPAPVLPRTVDSTITAMAVSMRIPLEESAVRAAVKVPKNYYPVDRVLVGSDGAAWLRGPALNGKRKWRVVSTSGRLTETIEVPMATDIQWIDGSIWAVVRDADDVPSVVRLRRK